MEEGVLISGKPIKEHKTDPDKRLEICGRCPIFDREMTLCRPDIWMNPDTLEVSTTDRPGYKRGCGCIVKRKVYNPNAKCPLGLW